MKKCTIFHTNSVFQKHRGIYQDRIRDFLKRHGACISENNHKISRQGSDLIEIKYFSSKDRETLELPQRVCEVLVLGNFLTSNWDKTQGTELN